jgi:two-component system KDP operon response regulator KdpE
MESTLKILVAEDEPKILRIYELLLGNEGYQVYGTKDGKECFDVYKTELKDNNIPFDLVLLDLRMPEKDGVEVAKEIFAVCSTQKILMVTAYAGQLSLMDENLKKLRVIEKPFDADELLKIISQLTKP